MLTKNQLTTRRNNLLSLQRWYTYLISLCFFVSIVIAMYFFDEVRILVNNQPVRSVFQLIIVILLLTPFIPGAILILSQENDGWKWKWPLFISILITVWAIQITVPNPIQIQTTLPALMQKIVRETSILLLLSVDFAGMFIFIKQHYCLKNITAIIENHKL